MSAPPDSAQRQRMLQRLRAARARTDSLFSHLAPDGLFERPVAERHRLIFYVGHLEAFDWNLLCRDASGVASKHRAFETLFAFGIDPLGAAAFPTDTRGDWPSSSEIIAWRNDARADVDAVVMNAAWAGWLEEGWAIHLAIEHRLMHAETLCHLFSRLGLEHLSGPMPTLLDTTPALGTTAHLAAADVALGLARATSRFTGWDNEYERHMVHVPAFELDTLPVSNAQWLEFIDAGGYAARELWSADDWAWRESNGVHFPSFWRRHESRWWWRATFAEVPLPLAWPVYVSHAEASAYTKWKGRRLMHEAEWHRAAPSPAARSDELRFDPRPSGLGTTSSSGVHDLNANGWEWTDSVFAPFEDFEALPFYAGYSANFFDGKHFVLKGASARTEGSLLRPSFRNWFQPHYASVFAKFRLAR